jgi:hypothetical protein
MLLLLLFLLLLLPLLLIMMRECVCSTAGLLHTRVSV